MVGKRKDGFNGNFGREESAKGLGGLIIEVDFGMMAEDAQDKTRDSMVGVVENNWISRRVIEISWWNGI